MLNPLLRTSASGRPKQLSCGEQTASLFSESDSLRMRLVTDLYSQSVFCLCETPDCGSVFSWTRLAFFQLSEVSIWCYSVMVDLHLHHQFLAPPDLLNDNFFKMSFCAHSCVGVYTGCDVAVFQWRDDSCAQLDHWTKPPDDLHIWPVAAGRRPANHWLSCSVGSSPNSLSK